MKTKETNENVGQAAEKDKILRKLEAKGKKNFMRKVEEKNLALDIKLIQNEMKN